VRLEKETVLRKMKEQQKHSCSCAVCGRKRNAIEEELEVLYDAYYDELESYASWQMRWRRGEGGEGEGEPPMGPFPGSVVVGEDGRIVVGGATGNEKGKAKKGIVDDRDPYEVDEDSEDDDPDDDPDDDDDDPEDDPDDDDEPYEASASEDDDEPPDHPHAHPPHKNNPAKPQNTANPKNSDGRKGFFSLGSGLTVSGPGNILTVADDLLKNDGQKFLEMMEQLAERRMMRDEDLPRHITGRTKLNGKSEEGR
jgi:hypothetical protein